MTDEQISPTQTALPQADKRPIERTHHGDTFVDDFEWLRDKEGDDTRAYLESENAYADDQMIHLKDLREAIFEEIKARTLETDLSVPSRTGSYWYYRRTQEGQQYPIVCRAAADEDDWTPPQLEPGVDVPGEEILVDCNDLAEGKDYFSLGAFTVTLDEHLLAYSTDTVGRRALHGPRQGPPHRRPAPRRDPQHPARGHLVVRPGPTSSTRRSTTPGAPTRSGDTSSARPLRTTCWSTRRPTRSSGVVRRPDHERPLPDDRCRLQDHLGGADPRGGRPDRRVPGRDPASRRHRVRRRARRGRRPGPPARPAQPRRPQLHPRHRHGVAHVDRRARDRDPARRHGPPQRRVRSPPRPWWSTCARTASRRCG